MTYTLDAGRCIVKDGIAIATIHGVGQYDPCEIDALAREIISLLNCNAAKAHPSKAEGRRNREMTRTVLEEDIENLLEALKIVLVQFGPYKDGDGAAKFHAINIAKEAIAKAEGKE